MMRVQIQSFRAPRWLGPLLVLAVLALIPFALALGLTLALGLAVLSAARLFLPSQDPGPTRDLPRGKFVPFPGAGTGAIDAEYEVKDQNEKGN